MAIPGGGPGRFEGRMRIGGAGGGSVGRGSRRTSTLASGTGNATGTGAGGAGGGTVARAGGFSAAPFSRDPACTFDLGPSAFAGLVATGFIVRLPFDFAGEVDATEPRVEEGTARAAEPVRGRGIEVGDSSERR